MRLFINLGILILALSFSAFAQGSVGSGEPTEADKTAAIPSDTYLKRGEPIGNAKKVSLEEALKDPSKFGGKTVLVEGIVVRACTVEGCWADIAPAKDAKSVHVTMKDRSFFIPLQSAGASVRAEGVFSVKTLTKAQVDHMIAEDGAKFDNRNADGTVTEVSFEATGIELRKKL